MSPTAVYTPHKHCIRGPVLGGLPRKRTRAGVLSTEQTVGTLEESLLLEKEEGGVLSRKFKGTCLKVLRYEIPKSLLHCAIGP